MGEETLGHLAADYGCSHVFSECVICNNKVKLSQTLCQKTTTTTTTKTKLIGCSEDINTQFLKCFTSCYKTSSNSLKFSY